MGAALMELYNPLLHPDYYDPWLDPNRHPELPAGINSSAWNQDEFNGPGYNEPIWPLFFDAYKGFLPTLTLPADMEVFSGCPDLTVRCVNNVIMVPCQSDTIMVRR